MRQELNIDGLVGPTHHHGGLGVGNLASRLHRWRPSNPQAAALEGLNKAWLVARLGVPQILLPPLTRPNRVFLKSVGFRGDLRDQLKAAYEIAPELLSAAMSASGMWTANAATVSPSTDCRDSRLHITPANLISSLHRAQEASERCEMFRALWSDDVDVVVHDPLPAILPFRDEGAANHLRLCDGRGNNGIEIFISGDNDEGEYSTKHFIIRQARRAARAIERLHELDSERVFHLQQSPQAIDAGVFHNDVISTAHEHLWFYHEDAFVDAEPTLQLIARRYRECCGKELRLIRIDRRDLPLEGAVKSYLFNSQIVTLPKQEPQESSRFHWIAPANCQEYPETQALLTRWREDETLRIEEVHFVPLHESMANGGGPACLRLRISLDERQLAALPPKILLDLEQYQRVQEWIVKWYPTNLSLSNLADWQLVEHLQEAVAAYPYRSFFVKTRRDDRLNT